MWGNTTPSGVAGLWESETPAAILRKFGTDAHVYIPGIGSLNGAMAANYVESTFITPASKDGVVGGAKDNFGGIHATQATTANKPLLRQGAVNNLIQSGFNSSTVGAVYPTSWSGTGGGNTGSQVLAEEVVDGNVCKPYRLYVPGSVGIHGIQQPSTLVVGVPYTLSAYIRVPTGAVVDGQGCWCYLGGGTPGHFAIANAATLNAQPKDTWVRYSATITFSVLPSYVGWSIGMNSATTACTFDLACLQAEIGSVASPYIPTTTAPASAGSGNNYWAFDGVNDTLLIPSSPIQTQDDSVLIGCAKTMTPAIAEQRIVAFRTATPSVTITIGATGPGICSAGWSDDAATAAAIYSAGGTVLANTPYVIASHKVGNNKKLRLNGVQQQATNTTVLGTSTIVNGYIGSDQGGSAYMNGNIYCVIAIKGTVSDAELKILERWAGLFGGVTI